MKRIEKGRGTPLRIDEPFLRAKAAKGGWCKGVALVMLCVCLGGCTTAQSVPPAPTNVPSIHVMVSNSASPSFGESADYFAHTLGLLSEGKMTAEVEFVDDIVPLMKSGAADIYFVSNADLLPTAPMLLTLELPYLFEDAMGPYDYLNSKSFHKIFSKLLPQGVTLTQATLGGGRYLFSTEKEAPYSLPTLGLRYPYYDLTVTQNLGANLRVLPTIEEALAGVGVDFFEFSLWQLPQNLSKPYGIAPTPHSYDIGWILTDDAGMQPLSPSQKAFVLEATTRAGGMCLQNSLMRDAQSVLALGGQFSMMYNPISSPLRGSLCKAAQEQSFSNPNLSTNLLKDLQTFLS